MSNEQSKSEFLKRYSTVIGTFLILIVYIIFDYFDEGTTMAERIALRKTGPFHLRLLLQPITASILGIIDGLRDTKFGKPPFIIEIFTNKNIRKRNIYEGFKSITTPLIIGVILDGIVQFLLFESVRIIGAIVTGIVLIGLPYALSRGISNRLKSI